MDVDHAARVGSSARNDALGGESLGEGTFQDAAVIHGDTEQTAAQERDGWRAAHSNPRFQARASRAAARLVVAGGRLSPEVKLGAIGLHLPPDGENAQAGEGKQKQLLHGSETLHIDNHGDRPGRGGWAP